MANSLVGATMTAFKPSPFLCMWTRGAIKVKLLPDPVSAKTMASLFSKSIGIPYICTGDGLTYPAFLTEAMNFSLRLYLYLSFLKLSWISGTRSPSNLILYAFCILINTSFLLFYKLLNFSSSVFLYFSDSSSPSFLARPSFLICSLHLYICISTSAISVSTGTYSKFDFLFYFICSVLSPSNI